MDDDTSRDAIRFRPLAVGCSLLSVAAGSVALIGWGFGLPSLTSLWSGRIPMAPSTGLLFILYGVAAFLRGRWPTRRGAYRAGMALNAAGATVALPLLFLSFRGVHPSIEHLGFPITGTVAGAPIGHMSPVAALCFLLATTSFLALPPSHPGGSRRSAAALFFAFLLLAVSFVLLLAYLFGTPLFYAGSFIPPAATTSLAFSALGIALLALGLPHTRFLRREGEQVTRTEYALLLVFLLLGSGIVTLGYLYHLNHERRYLAEVKSQLSAIADLKVRDVVQYRKERLDDAGVFFRNASFSDMVRRFLEQPGDEAARRQIRDWIGNYGSQFECDRVILFNTRGVARYSVPGSPEPSDSILSKRAVDILRSGRVSFQDFYRNRPDGKVYLAVLVPILGGQGDGVPLGVLALRIDPEKFLYPLIRHWPTPSRTAETVLVRREGDDALYLNELRFDKNAALALRFPLNPRSELPAIQAVLGRTGIVEGRDYRGRPVIADVRKVPDSPWYVIARMDLSEVYEPERERLWWMVSLVSVMLLAAGAGVGLAWRQQRARFYREQYEASQERRNLEAQLRTAQRMESVGTLAGGIAHDFNNVLTVILGYGEMLKFRIAGDPKAVSDLDEMLRSAERASVLTRQILTFARRQIIELGNIDLNRVVADLGKLIRKVTREDIEFRTILAERLPTIRADRGQVEQVMMNLALNARDAMPGGGQLVVETQEAWLEEEYVRQRPYMKAGRYAVLSVTDTGIGMDEGTRERIFEPFFTTKGPDKGTGLGLAVVYGIVKQHNGFVHVYSEPGKGSTFRIYFPAVAVPADSQAPVSPGIVLGGSETILLAEDDEAIRNLAEKTLGSYGYKVLVACDGEEAVDLLRRHGKEVAMVVLDVVMPKKGGKQAYEEMAGGTPGLKVLFLSGYPADAIHDSFVLHPGTPFLQKPFGPGDLARKVREILDR
ncbi:MAG: response regulator [Deltaproteobacteria bacterium]|nr:response regulator [Deltaproteobacteria bacterium]